MAQRKSRTPQRGTWWTVLNSPLAIAVLTGVAGVSAVGVSAIYDQRQEADKDRTVRRANLANLLVEYRQRLSALQDADSELGLPEFKKGMSTAGFRKLTEAEQKEFEIKSLAVGKREWDIIRGTGSYVPTMPAYANLNLQTLTTQIEGAAGIPEVHSGALQILGILNFQPDALWIFVHSHLPQMLTYFIGLQMMFMNDELPLGRGDELTSRQERVLGFPEARPGELEKLQRENDALHNQLQLKLHDASTGQKLSLHAQGKGTRTSSLKGARP